MDSSKQRLSLIAVVVTGAFVCATTRAEAQVCIPPGNVQASFNAINFAGVGDNGPTEIEPGDFNHDGLVDVAVLNASSVEMLIGTAGGADFTQIAIFGISDPRDLVIADFDHNGFDDVAVADESGAVRVAFNNGFGFPGLTDFITAAPTALTAGDFDDDGNLDLAVADTGGDVTTLRGNGLGGFGAVASVAMPVERDMVTGDVDRDGNLDLVATLASAGRVMVATGVGDGRFVAPVFSGAGAGAESVILGDFDKDGFLDAVTADTGDQSVSFLKGDGTPSFGAPRPYFIGGEIHRVNQGDFDRDGAPDLLVNDNASQFFYVLQNDGFGDFLGPAAFEADSENFDTVVADLDGDGRQDVAMTLSRADGIEIQWNDLGAPCANPSFAWTSRFHDSGSSGSPNVVTTAHIKSPAPSSTIDARPDFLTANPSTFEFSIGAGLGNGDFDLPIFAFLTSTPVSIAAADMDGDLDTDVVVALQGNQIIVQLNNGSGTLGVPQPFGLGAGAAPFHLVLADVNFDAKTDIIVSRQSNDVLVGINNGLGTGFVFTPYAVGTSPGAVAVGDLDSDGLPDLVVAERNASTLQFFQNTGGGSFAPVSNLMLGTNPRAVALAHLDFDGDLDLVVAQGAGAGSIVQTYTGNGNFFFLFADQIITGGTAGGPHSLGVADLDGDGNKDFAITNLDRSRIDIGLGDGTGDIAVERFEMTAEPAHSLAIDDLDRDGTPDLVVTQQATDRVQSFLNDGTGRFSPPFHPAAGGDARGSASGDFDGDGKLDLIVANFGADAVTYFGGTGGGGFGPGVSYPLPPGSRPVWVSAEDYDNDGDLDVVASGSGNGTLVFLPWDSGGLDTGAIQVSSLDLSEQPEIHRAGDFNRDGNLDIAAVAPLGNRAQILLGDGTGKFAYDTSLLPGGRPTALRVGDFNRDGFTDVAITQSTDDVLVVFHLLQVTPTLSFLPGGPGAPVGPIPGDFDVTDVDKNGYLEFVVPASPSRVTVVGDFLTGYFGPPSTMSVGISPQALRAVDMNRDGFDDLVVTDSATQSLWVIPANGLGGFGAPVEMGVGVRNPWFLETADFDMDGRGDLAVVPASFLSGSPSGIAVVFNTNCRARLFVIETEPSSCDFPPNPLTNQPRLRAIDDGANVLACELRNVKASLLGSANLQGTTDVPPGLGIVQYTNLAIALPGGRGLRFHFSHDEARSKLSDSFTSDNQMIAITGPASVCTGDTAIFSGTAGFESYEWTLDSPPPLVTMADTIFLTGLGTGGHTLDLVGSQDSCLAADNIAFTVEPDLSAATVAPMGPFSVCTLCTGPALGASPVGGGAVTYQWGYRTTSGSGPVTPIGGETGPSYTIQGPDFPGESTYFVVVTITPTCGPAIVSSEVTVAVTNASTVTPVSAFTALSTDQQNVLEIVTPTGCDEVRLLVAAGPGFLTDPNGPGLLANVPCPVVGNKLTFPHSALVNDSKYYYTAFVHDVGMGTFSPPRTVTGRPFDHTTGNVLWAFSTGSTSMTQAGIRILGGGLSSVYIVTNDHRVYAVDGGPGGGLSLVNALPYLMGGPSQSWPPTVNFTVGGAANGAVFVSSQDGALYVLDAETLALEWAAMVGEPLLQAGPAGTFFSATPSIMLGARNTVGPNVLRAFDPDTGSPLWTFDNSVPQGGDGSPIGIVLSAASIDVANERVFVGSHVGPGNHSLWAVDFSGATPLLESADNVGDLEASPIYLGGGATHVVIGAKSGNVELRDANDVAVPIWAGPYNAGDGGIKGFVLPHTHAGSRNFMFSTATKITSIKDNGPGMMPTMNWQFDVATSPSLENPSIPLFLFGTSTAVVGTAGGTVVQLNGIDTMTPTASTPVVLGDGMSAVGPPSFDVATSTIYVGTTEGVIYAIAYPIP